MATTQTSSEPLMDNAFFYAKLDTIANANTKKAYKSQLNGLLAKIESETRQSTDKPYKKLVLHVMTNPEIYAPMFEKFYPMITTRKNMFGLVLVMFKYADLKSEYNRRYEAWKKIHEECTERVLAVIKTNEPSEKQQRKYLSYEEMEKGVQRLAKDNPHSTLKKSKQFCLIAMYTRIMPKRSDFGDIKIYSKDRDDNENNYLVLDPKGRSFFVFNKRNKTRMKKQLVERIDDDLRDIFVKSVKKHPREYLFIGKERRPYDRRTFSQFVIQTFKDVFDKDTGVSMIRHMYDTEKVNRQRMSQAELDHIAEHMGHSNRQQGMERFLFKKTADDGDSMKE